MRFSELVIFYKVELAQEFILTLKLLLTFTIIILTLTLALDGLPWILNQTNTRINAYRAFTNLCNVG